MAKLAVGPRHYKKEYVFTEWESIMSEIMSVMRLASIEWIISPSRLPPCRCRIWQIDHFRLIDTLRILPKGGESTEPMLGVEQGGLQSAEGLLIARYFMYSQLYFHHVRRIYGHPPEGVLSRNGYQTDISLLESRTFLARPTTRFWRRSPERLRIVPTLRTIRRRRSFVEDILSDCMSRIQPIRCDPASGGCDVDAVAAEFGQDSVRRDTYNPSSASYDFPVFTRDERVDSSISLSRTLKDLPTFQVDCIFIDPARLEEARRWRIDNRDRILKDQKERDESHGEA